MLFNYKQYIESYLRNTDQQDHPHQKIVQILLKEDNVSMI